MGKLDGKKKIYAQKVRKVLKINLKEMGGDSYGTG
jgi:hypothetical protein